MSKQMQRTEVWSLYDVRTGARTTGCTFLSRASAQAWLDRWEAEPWRRPDLDDLRGHVEVRKVQ